MSLETILAAIEAEESARIAALEQTAQAEAAAILQSAEETAARVEQEAYQQALSTLPLERVRRHQQAKLQAVQLVGQAHERAIRRVLEETRTALADWRQQPTYPDLLHALLAEAVDALGAEADNRPLIIEADPRDQQILAGDEAQFAYRFILNSWGGVIVMTPDEQVIVDNTLESRFKQAEPFLRQELARRFLLPLEQEVG